MVPMRAAVCRRYGPPSLVTLEEMPKPVPGPKEILVRIRASTVSTADWRVRSLEMPYGFGVLARPVFGFLGPRKPVLGTDFAGDVEAVGALARKPDRLSYAQAAALPFGGMAALAFLRDKGKLKAGEHVAIVGASGSVGSAANAKMALAIGADRDGKRQIASVAAERVEDLRFLAALAEAGHFTPFVDREYDLADAAQAHAYVATGRKRGNVVLTMG